MNRYVRLTSERESILSSLIVTPPILAHNGVESTSAAPMSVKAELLNRISRNQIYSEDQMSELLRDTGSYQPEITLAIELLLISQPRLAIFVLGRTLEGALRAYVNRRRFRDLKGAAKQKIDFHNLIEYLKKKTILTEGTAHKMLSLKSDRNYGGHPAGEAEIAQLIRSNRQMFELGVLLIKDALRLLEGEVAQI